MKLLLKLAFKNILNYSKQSKSTLLSVAAAFISLVLFQGYIKDLDLVLQDEHSKRMMLGDFIVENRMASSVEAKKEPWKFLISDKDQLLVKDVLKKYVKEDLPICSVLQATGMIQKKSQQFLFVGTGYDVEECRKLRMPHWEKDTLFGKSLYQSQSADIVVLGQTLAKNFDCEKKDKTIKNIHKRTGYGDHNIQLECTNGTQFNLSALTINNQINTLDVEIIGVFDGGYIDIDARAIQLPLVKVQDLYDTKGVSFMSFESKTLLMDSRLLEKIQAELPKNVKIQTWKKHENYGDFYRRTMDLMTSLKVFVVMIVLVIVSLSIMNSLLKSIKERTKEIGTMRSLGYTRTMVKNIFFIEVGALSIIGSIIGVVLSAIITFSINLTGIEYKAGQFVEPTLMTIAFDPLNYLIVTGYILVLSLVGCFFVIKGTLNQTVAENLIHT